MAVPEPPKAWTILCIALNPVNFPVAEAAPPTPAEQAAMPPTWHPMVRRHPVSGRKSLYISSIYNDAIEGMADEAARKLLEELTEFSAQPQYMYRHVWEPDDVLMWDNRCTVHAVTPHDPDERRVMHRTTIVGTEPVIAA